MPPEPLVPSSSLRPLLTLVTAVAFLVMGMVAIAWVVRLESAQWLAASLATAAMGAATVRLATASPLPPGASVGRTVGWSLVLGLANVPVSFLAASLVAEPNFFVIPLAAFATVLPIPAPARASRTDGCTMRLHASLMAAARRCESRVVPSIAWKPTISIA